MRKTTELAIRAKAAIRYPGWRLDIVGPTTAVLTNMMGRRRMVTFRRRRKRRDGPWMRLVRWIISQLPAALCQADCGCHGMDCAGGHMAAGDVDGSYGGHGAGNGCGAVKGGEEDVQPRGRTAGHNGPAGRMAQ